MLPPAVLVVDPSPVTARRVQEALAGSGIDVVIAANADQARSALGRLDVSVVLASTTFPGGNGYDFARAVRDRNGEAVVYLLCGSTESYDGVRAAANGIEGPIVRPFAADTLRRHVESVVGPLNESALPEVVATPLDDSSDIPSLAAEAMTELPDAASEAVAGVPEPKHTPDDERLATFLPRDWRTYAPVRVDPEQVGPAVERAILEVLPEVVELVLRKALHHSPAFRDLVAVAVEEAVRTQVEATARKVIRDRLAEIEAGGDKPG